MTAAAGFAEMFEWADGNPTNQDRAGHTVALFQGKIVLSTQCPYHLEATDIIGVVGGDNTSVAAISNASPDEWHGKHLRDQYNRLLWEPQSMVEWVENGYRHWYEADRVPAGITVPDYATYYHDTWKEHKLIREVLSEPYKNPVTPPAPYLPRWQRPEWAIVVIVGRVVINAGQLCNPAWQQIDHNSNTVAEWLVR